MPRFGYETQSEDIMKKVWVLTAALLGLGLALFILLSVDERLQRWRHVPTHTNAVPFGVLGDSDSHAYHDEFSFGHRPEARGGALRQRTWQWTEVLGHLRSEQLDPGPWGQWGTRYRRLSVLRDAVGQDGRFLRKEDYLYNQAYSGAVCANLNVAPHDQVGRLLTTMARESGRWQRGVVVIRMGTNDFGRQESLDALSRDPLDPQVVGSIDACLGHIGQAVARLHAVYPGLRIVLVGIFNNAEWEKFHHLWRSPQAQSRIHQGLARFDDGLKALAQGKPGVAMFDDQAWFAGLWGSRSATGQPAYRNVRFGDRFEVRNTGGDEPMNATLADGHAGSVWNALWAQAMVALLVERFGVPVPPLQTQELVQFVDPDGRFGMR